MNTPDRPTNVTLVTLTTLCLFAGCTAPDSAPAQTAPETQPALEEITVVPSDLRPPVLGRNAGVAAGHPLTSAAALEVLMDGGNAFDAGVAAMIVGGVVEQDLYGLGGEGLVLVYPRDEDRVVSIAGQGWAPRRATIEWYRDRGKDLLGYGLDPAVVPGAIHAALTVLERWGTMSLETVARRAIEYAEDGFPLRPRTASAIQRESGFITQWPTNRRVWLKPDGSYYIQGETIRLPDLAATLRKMVEAERDASGDGREAGIAAARDRFYKGDIAADMVEFLQANGAPFELDDFSEFFARIEAPTSTTYKGYTVYKQSFNSQGPMLLETLNILENFDLRAMGHNSADYLHTLIEALKLAYADRDTYFGDPDFVDVPGEGLLSKEYARERAALIDMTRASTDYRAGDPLPYDSNVDEWPYWIAGIGVPDTDNLVAGVDHPNVVKDTTHISVIDRDGNVFDATPSGGWIGGAVIIGETGVGMSVRGEQFWLDPTRAAQLRPRSRPRYTLTPSIVLRDGEPFLAIGTPGGDNQEQTILQTFLNIIEFEELWYPNMHGAIQLPRVQTLHFYESFWPHDTGFNRVNAESVIPLSTLRNLVSRGHEIYRAPALGIPSCATIVMRDPRSGNLIAGADARRDCYAMAY
jgi:gamma-glutamyltranspeptidase/glutathione hydrolase